MLDHVVVIYCVCDEVCQSLNIRDDIQCKMTSAEVMTFAILSAMVFACDYKRTRLIAQYQRFFSTILSHSQLVRRIHRIDQQAWTMTFLALRFLLRDSGAKTFIVDSFPIKAFENHKSFRARIFRRKEYHGYTSSRKQFFFGIKVHMIVGENGVPIEFSFTPGSVADISALRNLTLDLPEGSILLGDRAYTDYLLEDTLREVDQIYLVARRKAKMVRQHGDSERILLRTKRNRIESVFSSITSRMPRHLKVRTEKGFFLKITFFILAYMIQLYHPLG